MIPYRSFLSYKERQSINIIKMSVHNPTHISYRPASKTLVLELGKDTAYHPNTTRLFPQRVKKLQQPDIQRKVKAVKMI